jgi:hypothetical protein
VEVAREDETERFGGQSVNDARKMAEQEAEGAGLNQLVRVRSLRSIGTRVDANDRDPLPPDDDSRRGVDEQSGPSEIRELRRARERITGDRHVVVAEDDERLTEPFEHRTKPTLAPRM